MNVRETLISSGEHITAVRRLGESYSVEEYLEAVELARAGGAGERYADSVLGVDLAVGGELLRGAPSEVGRDVQAKADEILRRRNIRPEDATQAELLEALKAVSA